MGPSIASGSQTWKGNWADLPIAPRNRRRAAAVSVPWPISPALTAAKVVDMSKVPTSLKSSRIPRSSPTSPILVVIKAFLAASAADRLSYQKPMSRYEHTPTSSQTT